VGLQILINYLDFISNYGFPLALSIYLILRIDQLMTKMVKNQKSFQDAIILEIKDIKKDIYDIRLDMAKKDITPGL